MAISLERSSLFGLSKEAVLDVVFGTFFVTFLGCGRVCARVCGQRFSSMKIEVFVKAFNKNLEFYRSKKPSRCILSK